ncbi:ATP-binding protein [Actinosynnema sp. NPDC059797]
MGSDGPRQDNRFTAGALNEVTSVNGSVVQTGSVTGGVHLHHGRDVRMPSTPHQLPPPNGHFVARDAECARLADLAAQASVDAPVLVVISGPSGVGKTTLAINALQRRGDIFPNGQLYANLRPYGNDKDVDPGEVLGQFLRALGIPPEKIPVELSEQQSLFRTVTSQRSLLTVLDNASSAGQVQALMPSGAGMTVATSRSRLGALAAAGGHFINLAPLDEEGSLALLRKALGPERVAREPRSAAELAELCHGMPLALCGASARLSSRPERSIAKEVSELRDEHQRLSRLSVDPTLSVRASFDLSYREQPPPGRKIYRLLSLHPGTHFTPELASAAARFSPEQTDRALTSLVNANLLESRGDDTYRFNDLIRIHARECCERRMREEDRTAAFERIVEWYVHAARAADRAITPYRPTTRYADRHDVGARRTFDSRKAALTWLDEERGNLMAVTRSAHSRAMPEATWHLCDALWSFFLYRRHYRDRLEIDSMGVESARAWGNRRAEADMLKRRGRLFGLMGRFTGAVEDLEEAVSINRSIGNPRGEADSLADLGRVHHDRGRADDARRCLEQALRLHLERDHSRDAAVVQIHLGLVLLDDNRHERALEELRQAHATMQRHFDADPYNYARSLIALGRVYVGTGLYDEALDHLTEGLQVMRQFGSEYRLAEVWSLLGQVAEARGRRTEAETHYRGALQMYLTLDAREARSVEQRLHRLRELGGTTG